MRSIRQTVTCACLTAAGGAAAMLPAIASAHPGAPGHADAEHASGFVAGLMHPITGLDHILAMAAVGFLGARMSKRAAWGLPLTFLAAMSLGGTIAFAGGHVESSIIEHGIVISVLVLGAMIALGKRLPMSLVAGIVAIAALFHGHAHGTELPESTSMLTYSVGILIATAALHAAGIAIGSGVARAPQSVALRTARFAGAAIAACGAVMLVVH